MNPTSLYVHIPFCTRKCLFCSFAVSIGQNHRAGEYVQCVISEMSAHAPMPLSSVYVGGGTPSSLGEQHLSDLMSGICRYFFIEPGAEFTVEVNPEDATATKARWLKKLGVNRVSIGVQSLQDRYLKFLGRAHDSHQARAAYEAMRSAGFENINLDVMYAFPHQTASELEQDVRAVAELTPQHISLYSLTIEPNSRFYATQMKLDGDEKLATHYELTINVLREYGYAQYEISNFAKPGFESMHNMNYWLGGSYIGLGMGAHGYWQGRRYWNVSKLQEYFNEIQSKGQAIEGFEDLSLETMAMEKVLFGLRMNKGIEAAIVPLAKRAQVDAFISDGFLVKEHNILKVTDQGRLVLDEIAARLV